MELKDSYKTIACPSEGIQFKEKGSTFFGYAFPIKSEIEVKTLLHFLRKKHFNADHVCYAFQIGTENIIFKRNDDGEPNNTAGMPIYGQIQSFCLTNVLVVVLRFFGGTKLGVGGLVTAYKNAATLTLTSATIIEQTINKHYVLTFDYKHINSVMRVIKEKKIEIISKKMALNCEIEFAIRKKNAALIFEIFNSIFEIKIEEKKKD